MMDKEHPLHEWQPIAGAPDDFERPGGQRSVELFDAQKDATYTGRRALFNNSGWREDGSNKEIWPTHWRPLKETRDE